MGGSGNPITLNRSRKSKKERKHKDMKVKRKVQIDE
jgi:hypothetical protein